MGRTLRLASRIGAWCVPPAVVAVTIWLTMGGPRWDSRVPVAAHGDALFYLAQSKSTLDHGWWWHNPSIGVPGDYQPLVFPQTTNVDQAIVWVVGRFTKDIGLAINWAWILIVALGAVTAMWGLRLLGVSRLGAGAGGILFALSPFEFYRNIAHFNLVPYLVPFPATVAVLLASAGREPAWRRRDLAALAGGCALLGFNYIYNAFFGAILVGAGLAIGFARTRSASVLKAGAGCLGAIVLAVSLNFAPTVLAWRQHGPAFGTTHLAMESDYYGLKIRSLVSPVYNHWFPPFRSWLAAEEAAAYPFFTESRITPLGVIATAGWLALMFVLIAPRRTDADADRDTIPALARLSVVVLLVAAVGGLGSLFSLISPMIRGYSRITPFIAFFAVAAVGLWIDRLTRSRPYRVRAAVWASVLVLGIADQRLAISGVASHIPFESSGWSRLTAFVSDLEARLPRGAMVFQLPLRPYPVDPGIERMGIYDHFRPYLVSHHLRWSYPVLTARQVLWERTVVDRPLGDWPARLSEAGFSVILIDRAGYRDGGQGLVAAFREGAPHVTVLAENDDYLALDLRTR